MVDKKWLEYIKHKKIITIDPGKEGGIAVCAIVDGEAKIIELYGMPETPLLLIDFLKKWQNNSYCFLEKVQGIPGMGASAMFNFGKGVGHIEMALTSLKIPFEEVTPQVWQKHLKLGTKGNKTTTQWKTKLMEIAQRYFPEVVKNFDLRTKKEWLRISDALLIMKYALDKK